MYQARNVRTQILVHKVRLETEPDPCVGGVDHVFEHAMEYDMYQYDSNALYGLLNSCDPSCLAVLVQFQCRR